MDIFINTRTGEWPANDLTDPDIKIVHETPPPMPLMDVPDGMMLTVMAPIEVEGEWYQNWQLIPIPPEPVIPELPPTTNDGSEPDVIG